MGINSHTDASVIGAFRDALAEIQGVLGLPQLVALLSIAKEPGLSVNELADVLAIPQQTASRHVSMLAGRYQQEASDIEFEPLIVQQINEADPRRRALFLTPHGLQLVQAILGSAKV